MTNDQINRLIAEELGWRSVRERYIWGPSLDGIAPGDSESSRRQVPDFCEDHNAVAEMRKSITDGVDRFRFLNQLMDDIEAASCWDAVDATPRQQAEAFLKMRGKWRSQCEHCLSDPCECCDADVSPDMGDQ